MEGITQARQQGAGHLLTHFSVTGKEFRSGSDFVFVFGMAADSYLSRIEVCEQKFDVTFYIVPILRVAAACRKS